jgi:hypothetical protein
MEKIELGSVVISDTGQSGCVTHLDGQEASVLLLNRDMWHGMVNRLRVPQDQVDLDSCPLDVERKENVERRRRD